MLYRSKNHRKYKLFCHIIFSTKYRRNVFVNNRLKQSLKDILEKHKGDFSITQHETDKNHIHFLLDYDPKLSVTQMVRHLKQTTTFLLWKRHRDILKTFYWKERTLWADGYFVSSIGESSPETIRRYIENQG